MPLASLTLPLIAAWGCGNMPRQSLSVRPTYTSDCVDKEGLALPASDLVVLDWNGGRSAIYPLEDFPGLDLSEYELIEGGLLADNAETFREDVRLQIIRIFCDFPDAAVEIRHSDGPAPAGATTVLVTQAVHPGSNGRIGEAEYDPCNEHEGDQAVIFGLGIQNLGRRFSYDDFVMAFANTIAHEIGHTLGYGHVTRDDLGDAGRSLYVELMLESHSVDELVSEQRFVVEQTNCPSDEGVRDQSGTMNGECRMKNVE